MVVFSNNQGAVYIFENPKAERVKVGMTNFGTVSVDDRLRDVNDKWLGMKATCQICGGRRLINNRGVIPKHVVSGKECPGGGLLPLEREVTAAVLHLDNMKKSMIELSGSEKGSITRIAKNLEKRIELYRKHDRPVGMWQISTVFYTAYAEQVESLSHEILANHLDKLALFGEVFSCTVAVATEAVEAALNQLGLQHSSRKEVKSYITSEKYGECTICGNHLTKTGSCPKCMQRYRV